MEPGLAEAHAAWRRGDRTAALERVRLAALAPNPTFAVLETLAQFCLELGGLDEAVEATRRAIALDPTQSRAWHRLGVSHVQKKANLRKPERRSNES